MVKSRKMEALENIWIRGQDREREREEEDEVFGQNSKRELI